MVIKTQEFSTDDTIYSFTSDADLSIIPEGDENVHDILNKVINTDKYNKPPLRDEKETIMNERYIKLQTIKEDDLLNTPVLLTDHEDYIKYRTIFDILLNYSEPNVSLQNQEGEVTLLPDMI